MSDHDPAKLLEDVESAVKRTRAKRATKAIGMFDLSDSTRLKLRIGHTLGTRAALIHNLVCRNIAEKFEGTVVKELGDGILIAFDDAVKACLAAIRIKAVTQKMQNCSTKAGLTFGLVEKITIRGVSDILGTTVDRCARLQASALPGQILVDRALHDSVASFLKDNANIWLSQPKTLMLKGIGETDVFELTTEECGFVGLEMMPFTVHEEGRLPIREKVAFMQGAKSEVIELGTGLTTFAGYFTNRRSSEFKDHVAELLGRGVTFKCVALNPDSAIAEFYAEDRKEQNLVQDIRNSITELQKQRDEFIACGLSGSFELYVYDSFPYFHAVCVDPKSDSGRMTVSHYMHRISRADTPIMQFSRSVNPGIFDRYWSSVQELLSAAKKL